MVLFGLFQAAAGGCLLKIAACIGLRRFRLGNLPDAPEEAVSAAIRRGLAAEGFYEVVSLPMHAYLDEPTQDRIIEAVRGALSE